MKVYGKYFNVPVDQKLICDVPLVLVENLLNIICEDDWYDDDYRSKIKTMIDTNSIPIFHTPLCADAVDPNGDAAILDISKRKHYEKYFPFVEPFLNILKDHYQFKQYAVFLSRCNPNKGVGRHIDRNKFLTECNRIHIPIQTNDKAEYIINDTKYYWKTGSTYEFDNTRMHSVYNGGTEPRIHLIVNLYNFDHLPVTI